MQQNPLQWPPVKTLNQTRNGLFRTCVWWRVTESFPQSTLTQGTAINQWHVWCRDYDYPSTSGLP
jgi:hypothetical protein